MCGITGIVSLNNNLIDDESIIVKMTDSLRHRGPDGEGYLFSESYNKEFFEKLKRIRPQAFINNTKSDRNIILGHRRLSIIDLSNEASQPMCDFTERYWIVFNGEIYNHRDLRKDLENRGYKFKSAHSDTEVIINAFAEWEIECIKKLRGIFSFGLLDKRSNCFYLVRDRLGVKPLFYTISDDILYFGSEIKAIFQNPDIQKRINKKALFDQLTFGAVPAPGTLFENIFKLPPAHYIKVSGSRVQEPTQYWDVLDSKVNNFKENDIIEQVFERFNKAVEIRREADVEYGALLSGGIDSSATVSLLSNYGNKKIKTFAAGFNNDIENYANEFDYAQRIADKFNTGHYEIELDTKDFHHFIVNMLDKLDEPLADTACIPIYYISKRAREKGVKVLLGGEGSDELHIGYNYWLGYYNFNNFFGTFPFSSLKTIALYFLRLPYLRNKRTYYQDWLKRLQKNQPVFLSGQDLRSHHYKKEITSSFFKKELNGYNSYESIKKIKNKFDKSGRDSFLDWMTYVDLNFRLPEFLLARLDRMTMLSSVEGRVPFLDHKFVEYCMTIPAQMKILNNENKYLVKKSFEGILPKEILYRKKDGFSVPIHNLLDKNELRSYSIDQITMFNENHGIFNRAYLDEIFSERNKPKELWDIFNISLSYNAMK